MYLNKNPITLGASITNLGLIIYDCFLGGDETYGFVHLSIDGYLLIIVSIVILGTCIISFMYHKKD